MFVFRTARGSRGPSQPLAVTARLIAGIAALLNLWFWGWLVNAIDTAYEVDAFVLNFGLPDGHGPYFAVPYITALLGLFSAWLAVKAWRAGYWSSAGRIHYAIVALSLVSFTGFLLQWEFIGLWPL
jgi:hypothetical protein